MTFRPRPVSPTSARRSAPPSDRHLDAPLAPATSSSSESRPATAPAISAATAWHGRQVLVTGAQGFIGRHLVRRLVALGAAVTVTRRTTDAAPPSTLSRERGDLLPRPGRTARVGCDLADAAATRRAVHELRPDVVFHLASRVQGDRRPDLVLPMLEDNTRTAVNVMAAAAELVPCRVVLAGSIEEARNGESPCSPYAAAKGAATSYAQLFHAQWGLPVTVARLAMVYGPDQPDTRKLLPYVVTRLLAGDPPRLGSGTRHLDWIYVDDVCEALLHAAVSDRAPGLVVDIGSGTATTIHDTVVQVAALTGYHKPLGFGERSDRLDDREFIADPSRAAEVLGWRARTPLVEGLTRTVDWYRSRTDHARTPHGSRPRGRARPAGESSVGVA